MNSARLLPVIAVVVLLATGCTDRPERKNTDGQAATDPFEINSHLFPGINLGNALEAPDEGDWGVTIQDDYMRIIKEAGFNHVRIPVRWSAHTEAESPWTVDVRFMSRVKQVVNAALEQSLYTVINIHHYEELFQNPSAQRDRFLALWQQIATLFQDYPAALLFEILNEPHDNLTPVLWNQYFQAALEIIRQTNPNRTMLIGTANWGGLGTLDQLALPDAESNIIITVHYYEPFTFTHQGAEWVAGSDAWLGTTWSASPNQVSAMRSHFDQLRVWAETHNRPIHIGEFGVYRRADMASRHRWTRAIVSLCKEYQFSWAYWEFCAGFGAYDQATGAWNEQLLEALIQKP